MEKVKKSTKSGKVFQPGEFRSRTQMPISSVMPIVLKVRSEGISKVRENLAKVATQYAEQADKDSVEFEALRQLSRHLIASMNYSVADCVKEMKKRGIK